MSESEDERRRGWIGAIANIASVSIAVVALIFASVNERQAADRFEQQLSIEKQITHAQSRPLLVVYSVIYDELKAIRLANRGLGPAIVTNVSICKENDCKTSLRKFFTLPPEARWDTYRSFKKSVIPQDREVDLVRLSKENLMRGKISESESLLILRDWHSQKSGIQISIEYTDIFGNVQPTLVKKLK